VIAKRKVERLACELSAQTLADEPDNAMNYTTGVTSASLTSTAVGPQVVNERAMFDEEECEWSGRRTG
jgi:hypothetical protein